MSFNWLEALKQNEEQIISDLYDTYRFDAVLWLKSTFNITENEGIDIFQVSVIQLYENAMNHKMVGFDKEIKSYLYGICKHKTYEFLRKKKRMDTVPLDNLKFKNLNANKSIGQGNNDNLQTDLIKKYFNTLKPNCQNLLKLFYYKNYSLTEIVHLTDYKNIDSVKTAKFKCLKKLKDLIH